MVQAADGAASSTAPSAQASPEPPPRLPSADDLLQGSCLGAKLVPPTISLRAQKFVKSSSAAEGLGLIGAMNEQQPLAISTGDHHLRSFKQPWDMNVCKISLQSTQRYEASGNAFHIRLDFQPTWQTVEIPGLSASWGQIFGCRSNWSDDTFKASSEDLLVEHWQLQ